MGLHAVFQFWDDLVGSVVSCRAQPKVIRGTVLWVNVSDSVWMQQLHLQKAILIQKINDRLPGTNASLTDIRFKLDTGLLLRPKDVSPPPRKQLRQVDLNRQEEFDKMIAGIKDDETRKSIKALWLKFQR